MKIAKKLILASVLSMMAAGCYAGSIVPGSEQQVSTALNFASPQQLNVRLAPLPGLQAGTIKANTVVATVTVTSPTVKTYAFGEDFSAKNIVNADTWDIYGKNSGKPLRVYVNAENGSPVTTINSGGHQWFVYNINQRLDVKVAGDRNIQADSYPLNINIAAYQA